MPQYRLRKEWIASSRSLSSGAHSRDPLAPRNDDLGCLKIESENLRYVRPVPGGVLISPAFARLRRPSWVVSRDGTVMARQPKLRISVGWCPWPERHC
jgi:hypothetical protein